MFVRICVCVCVYSLRTLYARRYKLRWYECLPLFSSTRLLKSRFSLHFYWYNHLFLLVLLLFLSSSTVCVSGLSLSRFHSMCVYGCWKYINLCIGCLRAPVCVCMVRFFQHHTMFQTIRARFYLFYYSIKSHIWYIWLWNTNNKCVPRDSCFVLHTMQFQSSMLYYIWFSVGR